MRLKITAVVTLLFSLISFVPIIANAAVADDKRIPDNPDFLPGSESYTYKIIDDINLRTSDEN